MLINKWLVAESFADIKDHILPTSLLLHPDHEPGDVNGLYDVLQKMPQDSFSILLSPGQGSTEKISDSYLEKIIGIFFQPCYYLYNYCPVLFLTGESVISTNFCSRLAEKCKKQGLQLLILKVKSSEGDVQGTQFAYQFRSSHVNYDAIVKNWLCQYLENKNPSEIHLLISKAQWGTGVVDAEQSLTEQEQYRIGRTLYEKQKLIDEYKHRLDLKTIAEKDAQLYLNIQKEQTAANVEWYRHEYEILPGWYKKFGHIIKVLMGKRTFRSLFDDKVKKYKD